MKTFLALALVACAQSFSAEVINVGIRVNFEYADLDHQCRLSQVLEHYRFSAEFENGKVLVAQLKKQSPFGSPLTYRFSEDEAAQIEIRTEKGLTWLKKLPASSELIEVLLKTGEGYGRDACLPPQELATVYPSQFDFDFGVEEVGYLLPTLLNSDVAVLRGQTIQKKNYQIHLSLTQDRR